jgi:2,3-dihydroxybenzoate decarboxylase
MVNKDATGRTNARGYLRIATEEAFAPASLLQRYLKHAQDPALDDPGFKSLWGFYAASPSPRARFIMDGLQDLGEQRLRDMDAAGIDHQIIALTSPGVQCFEPALATSLAIDANDLLADAVRAHPTRYTGMVAIAPQDPQNAVKEMQRGIRTLGFKAVILNGHTRGEYHDDPKFWPLFEAAEALDVPIYLHPNSPPKQMIQPFLEAGLDGAIYGFGVDTGLHMLRIICAGVFDRFPKLQFIIGHAGEALPYWLYRLDYMHAATLKSNRYPFMKKLAHPISHYLRNNIYITNSGVAWQPAIQFCQNVIGPERVMYAMDYPYQYVPDEVRFCDEMTIPDEHKKMFFQSNAEHVFKLNTPAL